MEAIELDVKVLRLAITSAERYLTGLPSREWPADRLEVTARFVMHAVSEVIVNMNGLKLEPIDRLHIWENMSAYYSNDENFREIFEEADAFSLWLEWDMYEEQ